MSEENKAILRRLVEEGKKGTLLAVTDKLFSPDFVLHEPNLPGFPRGLEGARKMLTMGREAAPDLEVTIEDIIAEGDKVAVRWTFRGTRADTGQKFAAGVVSFYRIADNKIAEDWGVSAYFQTAEPWE